MHQGADAGEMELPEAKVQCNSCVSVRVLIIDIMCKYGLTVTGTCCHKQSTGSLVLYADALHVTQQ